MRHMAARVAVHQRRRGFSQQYHQVQVHHYRLNRSDEGRGDGIGDFYFSVLGEYDSDSWLAIGPNPTGATLADDGLTPDLVAQLDAVVP